VVLPQRRLSTDHGLTWNGKTDGTGPPTQVSYNYGTPDCDAATPITTCGLHTSIFPWIAATGTGHVDLLWYGSSIQKFTNNTTSGPTFEGPNTAWSVFFAETQDGTANAGGNAAGPTIGQTIATHNPNHIGPICTGGTGCLAGSRTLGDFFQVAIEQATGCAVIAYANDRATTTNSLIPTQAYFNRQLSGCTSSPTAAAVSALRSHQTGKGIQYNWHSAKMSTTGYNTYGVAAHGKLRRLNTSLVLGTQLNGDLMSVFRYYARHAHVHQAYLERVQPNGQKARYGPYVVGKNYL